MLCNIDRVDGVEDGLADIGAASQWAASTLREDCYGSDGLDRDGSLDGRCTVENNCRECGQSLDMEVELYCEDCEAVLCRGCGEEHRNEGHEVNALKD